MTLSSAKKTYIRMHVFYSQLSIFNIVLNKIYESIYAQQHFLFLNLISS